MPKSPVPDKVRQAYIDNYLKSRQEGKIIDDLYWDGKYYFADNKGENWGGWRLRDRASHSAQGSKRRAMQRGAVASESLYIEAFGEKVGRDRYLEDKAELKRIWGTRGKAGFDIDHIYPLAAGGQETPRNLMLREASRNRSKGATPPTPEQRQALLLSSDPLEQIKLQGPQPTPKQRANILGLLNEVSNQLSNISKPVSRFGSTLSSLKDISQKAVDVKAQRMMDPTKRMPIDPKLTGPGGLARQAVKEIAEEVISVGGQALINQLTGAIPTPNKPRRRF